MKSNQTARFLSTLKLLVFFGACASVARAEAALVRISFLQDAASLQDTVGILIDSGCSRENIKVFEKAVRNYYKEPFDFEFEKFPKPVNGFYSFTSTQELLKSLPHCLEITRHSFDFNCMDMVVVTAGNRWNPPAAGRNIRPVHGLDGDY